MEIDIKQKDITDRVIRNIESSVKDHDLFLSKDMKDDYWDDVLV